MEKMYNGQLKKSDGTYSKFNLFKRFLQLVNWKTYRHYQKIYYPEWNGLMVMIVFIDCLLCTICYGAICSDYFEFNFINKSHFARRTYVTKGKALKIQKIFNRRGAKCMFDKLSFNKEYSQFRTLKDFDFKDTKENFLKFVNNCSRKIIAKPFFGYSGNGIFIPDVTSDIKAEAVYDSLHKDGNYFCEEFFNQTGSLHDVNPTSVNTIRIYTLNDGHNIHIMGTYARIGGKNSIVDNIHGGGACCAIDKSTGIISSLGVDLLGNEYLYSASGKMLPGTEVPQWGKVMSMVVEAAKVHPEVGYVGWDFAVSDDKICIIEANEQGNFDLPQTALHKGVYPDYMKIIKLRKKYNKKHN